MVPAEILPGAVTVRADPRSQASHFGHQLLAAHRHQIVIHERPPTLGAWREIHDTAPPRSPASDAALRPALTAALEPC